VGTREGGGGDNYDYQEGWFGEEGVVILHGDDGIVFHLDNYDNNNPEKWVRIQVHYFSPEYGGIHLEGFDVWTQPDRSDDTFYEGELVERYFCEDDYWIIDVYDFQLPFNPGEEWIGLKFERYVE
jgi:hypothetical protein